MRDSQPRNRPLHQLHVLIGPEDVEHRRVRLWAHGLSIRQQLEQARHLVRCRHAEAVLRGAVHRHACDAQKHLGVNLGVRQPERLHLLPDPSNYDLVEQQVRRGVVAQHGHQHRGVTHGQRHSRMHELEHARTGNLIDLQYRERIVEGQHTLLGEIEYRDEDGDFDQTRRREGFVATE